MRTTASYLHKFLYTAAQARRFYVPIPHKRRQITRHHVNVDDTWDLYVATILMVLIFLALFIFPTMLNWVFGL